LPGVLNWQHRLWLTMRDYLKHRNTFVPSSKNLPQKEFDEYETKIWNARNYIIATTTYHFKHTHKLSVGISRLQSLTNTLRVS
jgi:leucyl-tRNA synthetase